LRTHRTGELLTVSDDFFLENSQLRMLYSTIRNIAEVTVITTARNQGRALTDANSTVLSNTGSYRYK